MRNLLNPRWAILLNTIPVVFLLITYLAFYQLVVSQLSPENISYWTGFFFTLLALGLIHLICSLIFIRKKKMLSIIYGIASAIIYPVFIYLYWSIADEIFPQNIPSWMIPEDLPFYVSTALMPTIVHGIYVVIHNMKEKLTKRSGWFSSLYAVLIPVVWYFFFQSILPLWQFPDSSLGWHLLSISMVLSTVLFIFFVLRFVFVLSLSRRKEDKLNLKAWAIVVGIIFPIVGLLINNKDAVFRLNPFGESIFGDFSSPWYYIITVVNGLALYFSHVNNVRQRLALFIIKSIGFTYVLYFFLIFLPYLPLSILFIIIVGVGILMLTPLMLMMIQGRSLLTDYEYLRPHFSRNLLFTLFIAGTLILPASITFTYWQDRQELHKAMTYVFENSTENDTRHISTGGLKRTLKNLKTYTNSYSLFGTDKPILAPFYTWLVLDNMMLPEYKADILEEVFFGTNEPYQYTRFTAPDRNNDRVNIKASKVTSVYQPEGHWLSTIELDMINESNRGFSEFVGTFDLPAGTWVKDYYLYIDDKKEPGILAEKKAATWLYQQIIRGPRDPGILYYLQGNKVAFRVFPFKKGEKRTTGIELIHKEPIDFIIDDLVLPLGNKAQQKTIEAPIITPRGYYLSEQFKKSLPVANRTPYFHFLIDCSIGNQDQIDSYLEQVSHLLKRHDLGNNTAKVSLVNSGSTTEEFSPSGTFKPGNFGGGFFLEKAMKQVLIANYQEHADSFPVFVVISDDLQSAVFTESLADYAICFPETDKFFSMEPDGKLNRHSLTETPLQILEGDFSLEAQFKSSRKWADPQGQALYLADNGKATVLPNRSAAEINQEIDEDWLAGLDMQGQWQSYRLGTADPQKHWLALIKSSFQSQVMNPTTSFLALENESQKELLRRKQKQVLSGKQSFDLGDDVYRMSEPSWWILLLAMGLFLWFRKFR